MMIIVNSKRYNLQVISGNKKAAIHESMQLNYIILLQTMNLLTFFNCISKRV